MVDITDFKWSSQVDLTENKMIEQIPCTSKSHEDLCITMRKDFKQRTASANLPRLNCTCLIQQIPPG